MTANNGWCTCRRGSALDCTCPMAMHPKPSQTGVVQQEPVELKVGEAYQDPTQHFAPHRIFKRDSVWVCDWVIPQELQAAHNAVAIGHYVSTQGAIGAVRKLLQSELTLIQKTILPQKKRTGKGFAWQSQGELYILIDDAERRYTPSLPASAFNIVWREE